MFEINRKKSDKAVDLSKMIGVISLDKLVAFEKLIANTIKE
jgi:hypothetical protein